MFCNEHEPLALLVELTPKLAKKRFREEIYKAWNHECAYCGEAATSLDHVVPRFKSGRTIQKNLVPACSKCNMNKGSAEVFSWFQKQDFYEKAKENRIKDWMAQNTIELLPWLN